MADILPYLEVTRAEEPVIVTVPDLTGQELKAAEAALTEAGLTALVQGDGDAVTGQLPGPDTALEQGSQVLLYLGERAPEYVTVPDFTGMTPAQAEQAAAAAGVTLRISGNPDSNPSISVQFQDIPAGASAEPGCAVTVTLTDPSARD